MLCDIQQQDIFLQKVKKKALKPSQGALRLTCSLNVHTAKQCDKVYVPSMCEHALSKCFLLHASTTNNKEKRHSMWSRSHPDAPWCPFSALCQIVDRIVTNVTFGFVFSENENKAPDRFKSHLSYYRGFFFFKKKLLAKHGRGRSTVKQHHKIWHKT